MTDDAGRHIGEGIAWLGFWFFLAMMSLNIHIDTDDFLDCDVVIDQPTKE